MNDETVMHEIYGEPVEETLLLLHQRGGYIDYNDPQERDRVTYELHRELERYGLVDIETSDSDGMSLSLQGRRVAERIIASRTRGPYRRDAVHKALLAYLDSGEPIGRPADFVGKPTATAFGVPFTEREVEDATSYLHEHDLIRGFQSLAGFMRPEITYEGGYALHHAGTVTDYLARGTARSYDYSNTTTVSGGTVGGIQTGGSSNVQHVVQTITVDQQASLLQAIGKVRAALDDSPNDILRDDLNVIEAEVVSDEPDKTKIRDKIQGALITAGATGATNLVFQGLTELLKIIVS
jgi:hypothetical protein